MVVEHVIGTPAQRRIERSRRKELRPARGATPCLDLVGAVRLRARRPIVRCSFPLPAYCRTPETAEMISSAFGARNMFLPPSSASVKFHLTIPSRSTRNSPMSWAPVSAAR